MSAYVDPSRVTQLREIMGAEARSMIGSMASSLADAIARLEATVTDGELEPAVQVAHAARNDALMLGAGPLQEALREVETAAREADGPTAREMFERVRALWPPTRDQLAHL